jgi:histidinol-phosphatase
VTGGQPPGEGSGPADGLEPLAGAEAVPTWQPGTPVEADHGPAWSASWARAAGDELDFYLAFAQSACDAADELALRHFRRDYEVMTKPDRSVVTDADQGIERLIRERIATAFPDHGLVGEEYGTEDGTARMRWHIDPIDGTSNFVRGLPLFGTLLALEIDAEIQVGVVSAPALRERWYARRGGGAWAVGAVSAVGYPGPRAIQVSRVGALADAQLLYGSERDIAASGRAPGFRALREAVWRDRGFGDFWGYSLLAEGAAEGMVEADLSSWDVAAPSIVVEEAGGRMTDFEGRRRIDSGTVLGSNGLLHDELLTRLRG